jgi:hypothetical protein
VFNGIFEFHIPESKALSPGGVISGEGYFLGGLSVRLLYNFNGDRITDVGSLGLPDIIEEARGRIDLVALYRYNRLVFRFSADNLNDPEHLYTQGGEVQRLFKYGRTYSFSLGYAVF